MNETSPRKIKTGGDPRTLPDYAALRDEMSKLTHPARPDVNWHYVEKRCLSLFEHNGVELQTAVWYTLARTHLAGLYGLNEGLAILDALISHQWGALWPQPIHTRMEILGGLSQRLQQLMRTLPLSYSDLSQLYQAEQLLSRLGGVLQRLELKHLSQLDPLRAMIHNSAVRLENSDVASRADTVIQAGIVVPATVMSGMGASADILSGVGRQERNEPGGSVKWVYVAQPRRQANVEVLAALPPPAKKWRFFIAGICSTLAIGAATAWGWQVINPNPLSPVPVAAKGASLKTLEQMPALWRQEYGFALAARAVPAEAEKMREQWQRYISGNALPAESLSGWHQGMAGLTDLTRRLNALDERKGKYLTGSELKSMVFTITQSFGRTIPVEERLYRLSQREKGAALPSAQILQEDIYFEQLLNRYALIKQQAMR
ncbi:VasL domain-containing protein [Edwardsiella piscicida]|uniref:VasL domain-containing protein n=1 Tax=Edwardsiella piscicida TaxID=1263550 RepID=UPI00370D13C1